VTVHDPFISIEDKKLIAMTFYSLFAIYIF